MSVRSSLNLSVRVCVPPNNVLNQLADFHEIQFGGHVIEDYLDTIFLSRVSSVISKWRTFRLLRLMENLHHCTWDIEILQGKCV
jgi:hypothetical protein